MRTSFSRSGWAVAGAAACGVLLSGLLPVRAQNVPPPVPQAADAATGLPPTAQGDARLDRLVSVTEEGAAFEEVLRKLSGEVSLSVERECAAQKLHVRLKNRPLRVLMQALADLMPGAWEAREGGGYRFVLSARAAVYRKRWWNLYTGERDKALAAQRAAMLRKMRASPQPPKRFAEDGAAEDGISEKEWRAETGEAALFRSLPPGLQERIAGRFNDIPWYASASILVFSDMYEGATAVALGALPAATRAHLLRGRTPAEVEQAGTSDASYVLFANTGTNVFASLALDGASPRQVGHLHTSVVGDAFAGVLDHRRLAQEVKKMGRGAPPAWKELASYQTRPVWRNPIPANFRLQEYPDRTATLNWLADKGGIEFVADYHSRFVGPTRPKPDKLTRPLEEELNWQAHTQDMSWKRATQDLYLFRNNRWYRDDFLEVPAPLARRSLALASRWAARDRELVRVSVASPPPTWAGNLREELDWQAEVVATLTPFQVFNGLEYLRPPSAGEKHTDPGVVLRPSLPVLPLREQVRCIMAQYHTLRFYAALDDTARTEFLNGRLDFVTLIPAQKELAGFVLPVLQFLPQQPVGRPVFMGLRTKHGPGLNPAFVEAVLTSQQAGF